MMKYFMIFLVSVLSLFSAKEAAAQKCVTFKYDADGNRIKRAVVNNCYETKEMLDVQEVVEYKEVSVYPNPSNGKFRIVIPDELCDNYMNGFYKLYDMNGVVFLEKRLSGRETDVDIGMMPSGIYLVKIFIGEEVLSKVILKQ